MFDSNVNSLADQSISNLFVDNHTNSTRGNVPDDTSSAVVVFVRHSFVDRSISLNINILANSVCSQVCGKMNWSALLEGLSEEISGSSTITEGVRHSILFDSQLN